MHIATIAALSSKRTKSDLLTGRPFRYIVGMGRSNRTAALESKIALLLGEHEAKLAEIKKAERLVAALPEMRERLWEIETLVKACETVIRSDQPNWTREGIAPQKPYAHKIPVKLGSAVKQALEVLRLAEKPMTIREVAVEVLHREGHENATTDTITKVANTIGNGLRKGNRSQYVANDGEWPARWWVIKPTEEQGNSAVESR